VRLSLAHCIGVDNVIQFTVVLASGRYVTANKNQYSDLFWALRGGGGGTYGVVVSVTYRTHDLFPVTAVSLQINLTTAESALNVTTEFLKLQPGLLDASWGGYWFFTLPHLLAIYIAPNVSESQVNATFNPFLDKAKAVTGSSTNVAYIVGRARSFYDLYTTGFNGTGQVGGSTELISRLLSRDLVEQQPDKVAKIMLNVAASLGLEVK
jgi:FAD/FMN-containing dehydrogenase